jgi:hypothetical protein
MKRILTLLFSFFLVSVSAQSGHQIRIITEKITADSLFIKSFDVKSKKFSHLYALKFENDITIKDKNPLDAGIYVIETDSLTLFEFLISDNKNQKFTISILEDDIKIEGSKENSANRIYMKQMLEFDRQMRALDVEFQQLQQQGLDKEAMQPFVDTLIQKVNKIYADKKTYQEKIIAENKGLLLASIIRSSFELLPPPQDYYRDRNKLYTYMAEHHFDNFPWEDERMLNTPLIYNKFKAFAKQIFPLEPEFSIPVVLQIFNECKKYRDMYYAFFDFLEHEFGNIKSPYRDELLYIAMLKDIMQLPDLEEARQMRYEYELNRIDKNHSGDAAPDFNILLSNGDTTNLYAIDAELLMVYFQNPDCPQCGELREKMKKMELVNEAIASGKLKIVTIYFEKNEDLWRNYLKTRAYSNWLHGWNYDLQIEENHLYDIRTIPMIMFLDKDKKIIKKDLLSNEIESWLKRYL